MEEEKAKDTISKRRMSGEWAVESRLYHLRSLSGKVEVKRAAPSQMVIHNISAPGSLNGLSEKLPLL